MKELKVLNPIQKFIRIESWSGLLLFAFTGIGLLWANSSYAPYYFSMLDFKIGLGTEAGGLYKPIILWINDGLMAVFFFLIGLEIKREILKGELKTWKQASFPIYAAIAGMSFPALIFFFSNDNPQATQGWAIPMATDIAFSLAILQLLGDRVPLQLKIFLTAFAIVDDVGAVIIIALFYSSQIFWVYLAGAILVLLFLYLLSYRNFYSPYIWILLSILIWILFLKSGLHPTIAGVLIAFSIPITQKTDVISFTEKLEEITARLRISNSQKTELLTEHEIAEIDNIQDWVKRVQSPVQYLEHSLHNYVAYFIIPIFALANAGISFRDNAHIDFLLSGITAISLIAGNVIGIMLICNLALRLRLTIMPYGITQRHLLGTSFLAGVGFTMSIFIANLAFAGEPLLLNSAKLGIMIGSLLAGIVGYAILRNSSTAQIQTT